MGFTFEPQHETPITVALSLMKLMLPAKGRKVDDYHHFTQQQSDYIHHGDAEELLDDTNIAVTYNEALRCKQWSN